MMEMAKIGYSFESKLWKYDLPKGGWFFLSLPQKLSREIREQNQDLEHELGRLQASAKIGNVQWDTAIWFDTKGNTYLLPLKADIRKKLNLVKNQTYMVELLI